MRVAGASTGVSTRVAGADRQAVKAIKANMRVIEVASEVAEADRLVTGVVIVACSEEVASCLDFIRVYHSPWMDLAEA